MFHIALFTLCCYLVYSDWCLESRVAVRLVRVCLRGDRLWNGGCLTGSISGDWQICEFQKKAIYQPISALHASVDVFLCTFFIFLHVNFLLDVCPSGCSYNGWVDPILPYRTILIAIWKLENVLLVRCRAFAAMLLQLPDAVMVLPRQV